LKPKSQLQSWIWGIPITVFLLRCAFQGLLLPWELSGDEAQYWDWTRHPSLSYYTKGPGVTWLVATTTTLLGDSILGIRIGTFLCHAVAGIAVGLIAKKISGGNKEIVIASILGYQFLLGYQVAGSLMTVDMMMVAGWTVATCAAVELVQTSRSGRPVTKPLCLLGAALGVSFLAKYTALLAALGLLIGLWPIRKSIASAPGFRRGWIGCGALFGLGLLPVILWNAQRGWPTLHHLLGHLHVPGGDSGTTSWLEYDPLWTLQFFGQVFALAGPLLGYVLFRGAVQGFQQRSHNKGEIHILMWSALPVLLFYLLVSFKGPTEGNWIVGAYTSVIPLGAMWICKHPSTRTRNTLKALVAIRGVVTGVILLLLMGVAPWLNSGLQAWSLKPLPLHRVSGHDHFAQQIQSFIDQEEMGSPPVICDYYDKTALLAYYLPDRPRVSCASVALGSRPSAYDDFASTRFPDPRFSGLDVILVGGTLDSWQHALEPDELKALGVLQQRGRSRPVFRAKLGVVERNRR